ncbi:MAG TPA: DUF1918 domain-containing protein [Solirubrobacteraceae bacterium]|jgi:hypothetical protein
MTTPQASNPSVEERGSTPAPGDWIEVDASEGPARRGVILEVLGEGSHTHFRVRWDEEHISLLYPADRGFVIHSKAARPEAEQ